MSYDKILPSHEGLKLLANRFKNKNNTSHSQAVEDIAKELGFSTSNALRATIKDREEEIDGNFVDLASSVRAGYDFPGSSVKYFDTILEISGDTLEHDDTTYIDEASDIKLREIIAGGIEGEYDEGSVTHTHYLALASENTIVATLTIVSGQVQAYDIDSIIDEYETCSPNYSYPFIMDCLGSYAKQNLEKYDNDEWISFYTLLDESFYVVDGYHRAKALRYLLEYFLKDLHDSGNPNFLFGIEIKESIHESVSDAIELYNFLGFVSEISKQFPRESKIKSLKVMGPQEFNLDYPAINSIALIERRGD